MNNHRNLTAELPVIFLKEGAQYVAYTPALDLSTCGDTFEQARKRFAEAAAVFLDEAIEMGTLDEVLRDCGWTRSRKEQAWRPPQYVGQVQQEVRIPA